MPEVNDYLWSELLSVEPLDDATWDQHVADAVASDPADADPELVPADDGLAGTDPSDEDAAGGLPADDPEHEDPEHEDPDHDGPAPGHHDDGHDDLAEGAAGQVAGHGDDQSPLEDPEVHDDGLHDDGLDDLW
ncbi:hypothetical protein [Granulicoccus sp. GXG6511]|uniref:hypothetical protein n=1 Tax=Granulicoccus sp. GXG6511 TaxID=3381351 RepID=UPI003D7DC2D3